MVPVIHKTDTIRVSIAKARMTFMNEATLSAIQEGRNKKGDVIGVARIAGILAAKKTSEIIPLCHPIFISSVEIDFEFFGIGHPGQSGIDITATIKSVGKSGLEMEAMLAASVAGLTVYDMAKSIDKFMRMEDVRLTRKTGGRGPDFESQT